MKGYFNFTRKEKIGVVTLLGIILVLSVVLNVGENTYLPDPFEIDQSSVDYLVLNNEDDKTSSPSNFSNAESKEIVLQNFNPNQIGVSDWVQMGFSEKQAQSIVDFKNKYGDFKTKEDIRKLYVVSEEKYEEIAPFIQIPQVEYRSDNFEKEDEFEITLVELNSANSDELEKLRGIGPTYSKRIISYRDKIGGFVDKEQIDALYISDDAKEALNQYGIIDPSVIEKKNINEINKEELRSIPYSNWSVVALVLKQRERQPLTNLDFLTSDVISADDKERFGYYINF